MLANSIIDSFVNDISSMYSLVSLVILIAAFKLFRPNINIKGWLGVAEVKGWLGEAAVTGALAQLPTDHYHVLHDVLLPCSDGETTQVDHVVIGQSAVYVIETKNFNGAVYGQEKDAYWTVAYNRWSKHRFQNPIHQNYRHIQAIQEVVGSDIPVLSLVVFVRGTFPEGKPDRVLLLDEIARYIHTAEKNNQARDGITSHALGMVHEAMIVDPQAKRHHIQRLKRRYGGLKRRYGVEKSTPMTAKALVVLAVIVFVVGAVHNKTRKAAASHAQYGSGAQHGQAATPLPRRTMTHPVPSARIPKPNNIEVRNRHHIDQIEIIGSLNGMASIREGGKIYTLHNGDTTPLGWKLVAATPKGVDMIRPDGKPFHMDW